MNPLNYCTLEAAQRLVAKGIVLETEAVWCEYGPDDWSIGYTGLVKDDPKERKWLPAPSMAEVWRELPEGFQQSRSVPVLWREGERYYAAYMQDFRITSPYKSNVNPTDALISLLIWVTEQKEKEKK